MESGPLSEFRLHPDAAPVPLHDLFANGKPDAGAGIFAAGVQALEDEKNALEILRLNANAVVAYAEVPGIR